MTDRFEAAIAAIDAANSGDPNTIVVRGQTRPKELAHAELVTAWVKRLVQPPSEQLLLAARAHHLRRWALPRNSHPAGRSGYLRWRKLLHKRHADEVAVILRDVGYDGDTITRVQEIIRKQGLGKDPEVQALEDALCLVFIETQLHELASRTEPEKMVDIIRKTAAKMSEPALDLAIELDLPDDDRVLLSRALAS